MAGRSYQEIIDKGLKELEKQAFIDAQEAKAPRRRPRRVGERPKAGTLFAKRNKRLAIREGALRETQIIITYKKTTTGETKKYVVAPYEFKFRKLKVGLRKMLYAWDMKDRRIKSFALRDIRKVALTDRKFTPKWPIQIG
jgi:predicted DNA-binding transcriptional regulator YafY